MGSFSKASRQNLETREKSLSSANLSGAYTLGLVLSGMGRAYAVGSVGAMEGEYHNITALKMATFGLLPILRFFLG